MQMADIQDNPCKVSHKWEPIRPIEPDNQGYDFREIDSLQRQWLQAKEEAKSSTSEAYTAFAERLTRKWAIETGIIEGIYELDIGVTETLVREGIVVDYIERGSTNKEPSELVRILRDHEDSIKSVNYWIEQSRPLTKNFIKSLHNQILNSQDTHTAVSQFGDRFEATLRKGEFKIHPNNPTRPDRTVHEYCPPEQVESELDNLLSLYAAYDSENCPPLLLAAWLHHRFEQIHPFQDGNGRVGRAILTWHLVKNEFFPIVISRDDRIEYIKALEEADAGDLTSLTALFTSLQKNTILQAISAEETEPHAEHVPQVDLVGSIVERANRRYQSEMEQMRSVNRVALVLREYAKEYLDEKSQAVRDVLSSGGITIEAIVKLGGPDQKNEWWHQKEVLDVAKTQNQPYWVNLNEYRYFVRLSLYHREGPDIPNLIFVISLHHVGRQLTGIMASTAFADVLYNKADTDADETDDAWGLDSPSFANCTINPLTFTGESDTEELAGRFRGWMENCFSIALRHWRDNS